MAKIYDPANPIRPIPDDATPEQLNEPIMEEIIEQDSNFIIKSNPEQMEIHTHGHVHETKKWKEYLFQFLMLFLAVTAGFFMENQREHYIEGHRAKVMAGSLIEDLKKDTSEVSNSNNRLREISNAADSVMIELDKDRKFQNDSLIQIFGSRLMSYNYFDSQSGTYQQIKSSGSLRYFKPNIALLMTNYETSTNYIAKLSGDAMTYRQNEIVPFMISFRNAKFIKSVNDTIPFKKPYFIKEPTEEQFNLLYNMALMIQRSYSHYISRTENHRKLAIEQINMLKKEFEL